MDKINKIFAEEINDSRGNPTIRVTVFASGFSSSFSVPSGASTGVHEAHELRDGDGRGVKTAIEKINNQIASALIGKDVLNQKEIDQTMINLDGTYNKDNLGGNSMIGVSIACAKVAAKLAKKEVFEYLRTLIEIKPSRKIPYLYMNLIEGGKHANNTLAFQEYHIVPDTEDVKEAIDAGITIQNTLKEIIYKDLSNNSFIMGDEGGWAPQVDEIKKPLLYLKEAVEKNNLAGKIHLAMDTASSSFFLGESYQVDGREISKEQLLDLFSSLVKEFDIISIEDPFEEEDFESFKKLKNANEGLIVVGDDLTVTNKTLLEKAIKNDSVNAMIIKPNQIGTLTETLETMKLARENGIELIVSHRSGETEDTFIADLTYAFSCFGLKAGSPEKSERMVKYKRLEEIVRFDNKG